ncbi:MAG: hypothetical protein HWN66_11740 [Candidatus Helarchaeota archaeon]|nr:hypothetical protein [Candidatus Helarchaeota archaeon]
MATFFLESSMPLIYFWGELSRIFVSPYLYLIGISGDEYISTLEKRENIKKLIKMIEEKKKEKNFHKKDKNEKVTKRDWKKFLPF